ncbi:heme lyase CcmF/NrfE family subunit [Oceanidesulfovibrio marinus]|uniref:Heme lyase CcmF/NrfE family subunit n=1 Tax=Oceanidesulfovibrio marinus TaxID=370038 RepID=A0A6P1ZEL0_9BACT|nr:cytochrome c-type biogenesis CcmF C-terminal domain-containing protein [Oceanidesulfovibrio marinus]TVM33084.1 heme lyase CcmF/NrfE family subunit [Oceanidesulfovibrio marinus]
MYLFAYACLLAAMFAALICGVYSAWSAWQGRTIKIAWPERAQIALTALVTIASVILLLAFIRKDYTLVYVADYSDNFLPLFYRITAFWAGQAGSLLFWAWATAVFCAAFMLSPGYRRLAAPTRQWFWTLFLLMEGFFMLLLTCWSNPFIAMSPSPMDGRGLNPLLQNPGMIFHPPLLFLGYAGFCIPGCLGLAQRIAGKQSGELGWVAASRNASLLAWLFLTAGIILGGWWSYMELGWGGYWAWDPVENASLIPWFVGTAFLHTAVLERRRGALTRTNAFLASMALGTSFFATYLVRSGVVDSLHAFGSGGVALPLLIFILAWLVLTIIAVYFAPQHASKPLAGPLSREGFLFMAVWLLVLLGVVIILGTLWPLISSLWSNTPVGLEKGFYNRVCLPFFALLTVLLAVCPFLGWNKGIVRSTLFFAVVGVFAGVGVMLGMGGMTIPLALIAAAAALAVAVGSISSVLADSTLRRRRTAWAAYGVHLGLALVVLGVAFSGPYKVEKDFMLDKGEIVIMDNYTFTLKDIVQGEKPDMIYLEAQIEVSKDGKAVGMLAPQRRVYRKFEQPFAEASTIPGLGDELYGTLLGLSQQGKASLKLSVHPLINWIWIGGTLMCLLPFLGLTRPKDTAEEAKKKKSGGAARG